MPALGKRTPGLERHGFRVPVIDALLDPDVRLQLRVWETQTPVRDGLVIPGKNQNGGLCLVKA
jgi:hypothetical protein